MVNQTTSSVCCPRCRRTETTPLAIDGDRQRHQCDRCGEGFWAAVQKGTAESTPAAPAQRSLFAYTPIAVPEKSDLRMVQDGPAGLCPKCDKPYLRLGKRYEVHVETCKGVKFVAAKKRIRSVTFTTPVAPDLNLIYDQSIAAIRARRAALEAEMMGLDLAIAEIEKRRGAGGAAPVPFPHGSPVKPSSLSSPQASAAI